MNFFNTILLFFFVFLFMGTSFVFGAPSKGSTKASLKNKPQQLACVKTCADDYKPVCAGVTENGKNLTFGNECVLTNYNCENHKDLKIISQGECPEGGAVRLS